MSEVEIQQNISLINDKCQKSIKTAYEKSKKIRLVIQKHKKKMIESAEKLIKETDPQLTEEGVRKITKKGKIYFRSLKAFNPLLHRFGEEGQEAVHSQDRRTRSGARCHRARHRNGPSDSVHPGHSGHG